ncbi:hypothetical protein M404DRAFT_991242 [Pisolithus tinctorius Marx 270]|uniref:Uncharacterized protein n=1 Tax=Pisolithus tinctorius Marx 270 TaxID=870435 RepID=A0A0C3PYX0_PISTI|nr:hypothetical protein M404DRAFT_991242 [Pisolithus tinctorius Marx 270]
MFPEGKYLRCHLVHDYLSDYQSCVPDQFIGWSSREYSFFVICGEFLFGVPGRSDLPFGFRTRELSFGYVSFQVVRVQSCSPQGQLT